MTTETNNPPDTISTLLDLVSDLRDDAVRPILVNQIEALAPERATALISGLHSLMLDYAVRDDTTRAQTRALLLTKSANWDKHRPEIQSETQAEAATNLGVALKDAEGAEDAAFSVAKRPYINGSRAIDRAFSARRDPIKAAKLAMGKRSGAWLDRLEAARKAEQERQLKIAQEENRKREELAQQRRDVEASASLGAPVRPEQIAIDEAAEIAAATAAHAALTAAQENAGPVRTVTDYGTSSGLRKTWKIRIVSAKDVPRAYCSPDETLLKAALKAEVALAKIENRPPAQIIAGTEIYEERGVNYRG